MPSRTVRVACVQLSPIFRDVNGSIARADKLVQEIVPGSVDIVVLPEMAFPGYSFTTYEDAEPYAEDAEKGLTFAWASKTARRLGAYVFIGFAQRLPAATTRSHDATATDPPPKPTLHNALMIVSPAGSLVSTYAKHHLFETDKSWATAGPAFATVDLAFPESSPHYPTARDGGGAVPTFRVCPAICMDASIISRSFEKGDQRALVADSHDSSPQLNPDNFTAPWSAFELASFAAAHDADLVVCAMAWLVSEGEPPSRNNDRWSQVQSVLSYWAARLGPLLETGVGFVAANRVGAEGDVTFTGSSCAMSLSEEGVDVLAFGAKEGEEVVRATIELRV